MTRPSRKSKIGWKTVVSARSSRSLLNCSETSRRMMSILLELSACRAIIGGRNPQTKKAPKGAFRRGSRVASLAVKLLLHLAALLRFDGERRRGAREKALDSDRLPGLLAIPVAAVVDAR